MCARRQGEKLIERNLFVYVARKKEKVSLQNEMEIHRQLKEKATKIWYEQADQALQSDLFDHKRL